MQPAPAIEPGMSHRLIAGAVTADLFPDAGGRLGQLTIAGREVLRGPGHARTGWVAWGSYPLLPWSNRVPRGVIHFEGDTISVPVNDGGHTAMHGLAATVPWRLGDVTDRAADLTVELDADRYALSAHQYYELAPDHLDHTVEMTNRAERRIPAGLGIHPWFASAEIKVPAKMAWAGDGPLPDGLPRPVTPHDDLRTKRRAPPMDRCYTGLTARAVEVGDLTLSWTGPITQVVVYTGMPGWVCVEPVTMVSDGFRLADRGFDGGPGIDGTGVIALDPGATLSVTYRYAWRVRPEL